MVIDVIPGMRARHPRAEGVSVSDIFGKRPLPPRYCRTFILMSGFGTCGRQEKVLIEFAACDDSKIHFLECVAAKPGYSEIPTADGSANGRCPRPPRHGQQVSLVSCTETAPGRTASHG
jgi:hypothetical protein